MRHPEYDGAEAYDDMKAHLKERVVEGPTPGPWEVREGGFNGPEIIQEPDGFPGRVVIAECQGQPEDEANARLIAAAPELLEAAKEVLGGLNTRIDAARAKEVPTPVFDGIAKLHAAIEKAEGDR